MTTLVLTLAAELATPKPRLQGGWEFVWASYGITWGALALYALFLYLRRAPRSEPPPANPVKGSTP